MFETLRAILQITLERLSAQIMTYTPGLLAALVIVLSFYGVARFSRWLLNRIFKGMALDRFLQQSGLSTFLSRSGRIQTTRLVAESAFWIILLPGALTGLSVFNTNLTTRMTEALVFLFPKLVTAALILLAGAWLGQYLGRSTLVWAVNEGIEFPRRIAAGVRLAIFFVAIVVASDQLNFARSVFLSAFLIVAGGAVLTIGLILGLHSRDWISKFRQNKAMTPDDSLEPSLRHHL
ncbi:MAG: hypothetical protein U0V70_16575 [Terriglobia bacterium]